MKKQPPAVPCPKCHAAAGEHCKNYKGQNCAPHASRIVQPAAAAEASPAAEDTATTLQPIEAPRLARAIDALRRRSSGLPIVAIAWAHGRYAAIGPQCALDKIYVGPYRTRDELQKDLPRLRHLIEEGCP